MTTLFAMTQIFPALSLRAQVEFAREVVEEVIWDAGAQKLPIRLNRQAHWQRFEDLHPFCRVVRSFAEVLYKYRSKSLVLKQFQ